MPGRRKSGRTFAGDYAIESVDFWFNDPRMIDLTPNQKLVLFYLSLNCVRNRSEWISGSKLSAFLQRLCGVDARVVTAALAKLQQICLVGITPDSDVIVYGVRSRHENLKWKRDGISEPYASNIVAQAVNEKHYDAPPLKASAASQKKPPEPKEPEWFEKLRPSAKAANA